MIKTSEYVIKETKKMIRIMRREAKNVLKNEDPEAIHNFRVSARQLRSFLRTIKGLYPRFYLIYIQKQIRKIIEPTNPLRDLEVILEKLEKLQLSDIYQAEYESWKNEIKEEEQKIRQQIFDLLGDPQNLFMLKQLEALLILPVMEQKDILIEDYAHERMHKMRQDWIDQFQKISKKKNDIEWLHDFRLQSKKLRYNLTFYQRVLPPSFVETIKLARKMQNILGEVNDYEILENKIPEDRLSPELRQEILKQTAIQKTNFIKKAAKIKVL